jgi:DNA-binding NarL/FixJ family response regulator
MPTYRCPLCESEISREVYDRVLRIDEGRRQEVQRQQADIERRRNELQRERNPIEERVAEVERNKANRAIEDRERRIRKREKQAAADRERLKKDLDKRIRDARKVAESSCAQLRKELRTSEDRRERERKELKDALAEMQRKAEARDEAHFGPESEQQLVDVLRAAFPRDDIQQRGNQHLLVTGRCARIGATGDGCALCFSALGGRRIGAMIRVMVVDDHPVVVAGVAKALAAAPDVEIVGFTFHAREAVDLARQQAPDVVLMDVQMPEQNGILVARDLHEALPSCRVVGLSGFDFRAIVLEMLEAGALGYVLKDCIEADIVAAVRKAAAGEVFVSARLRPMIPQRLLFPHTFEPPRLTPRQSEVLRLVARGIPRKQVADTLGISVRTLEAHVHEAMTRLEVDSIADLVRYATAKGWVDERPAAGGGE